MNRRQKDLPFTQNQPIKIRDIVQKNAGNFKRFSIGEYEGRFFLVMEEKEMRDKYPLNRLHMETTPKRLEQLSNEILSYLKKEAKFAEWKPTMQEFEMKLREIMGEHGIEFWIIDWVRTVKTFENIRKNEMEQIKRIYEWLHSNREWLYK